jgi:glutamate synthase (NADPH/NADH) large chain
MGFTKIEEIVGRSDLLDKRDAIEHWKANGLDFTRLFHKVDLPGVAIRHVELQKHPIDTVLDRQLLVEAANAIETGTPVVIEKPVGNVDRSTGAMLSGAVAKKYGHAGLPEDTITVKLTGTSGQSFAAFLAAGVTVELTGQANDYVAKGLSGGKVIVKPDPATKAVAERSIIVGNTVLYGAIAGEAYFRGVAGERFAVRNSGAEAVVEGCGANGCEYMTGGVVAVLGQTGRNFAAGMSGGIAYVYDEHGDFADLCNRAMVELEPISPERDEEDGAGRPQQRTLGVDDAGMGDMLRHDAERLRILLERHHLHTGSRRARALLDDWRNTLPKFVKVMPRDYARALRQIEAERLEAASVAAE